MRRLTPQDPCTVPYHDPFTPRRLPHVTRWGAERCRFSLRMRFCLCQYEEGGRAGVGRWWRGRAGHSNGCASGRNADACFEYASFHLVSCEGRVRLSRNEKQRQKKEKERAGAAQKHTKGMVLRGRVRR